MSTAILFSLALCMTMVSTLVAGMFFGPIGMAFFGGCTVLYFVDWYVDGSPPSE